jgi:hypothetical protein
MTRLEEDKNQGFFDNSDFDEPEYVDEVFENIEEGVNPWDEKETEEDDLPEEEDDGDEAWGEADVEDNDDWDEDDDFEDESPADEVPRSLNGTHQNGLSPRPQETPETEQPPRPRKGFRRTSLVSPRWQDEDDRPAAQPKKAEPISPRKQVPAGLSRKPLGHTGPNLLPKPTYNPDRKRWQTHKPLPAQSQPKRQAPSQPDAPAPRQPVRYQKPPAPPARTQLKAPVSNGQHVQSNQTPAPPPWFVLEEVIKEHQPLPDLSAILGVDEAGKPLVISFEDPSLGALLIFGDDVADNRKHLGAFLASLCLLNAPEKVQVDIISPTPQAFKSKETDAHYLSSYTAGDEAFNVLGELLDLVEQRAKGEALRPIRVLVLDQVDQLLENLAPESAAYLRWLLRRGPEMGIWPIATLASHRADLLEGKTLNAFGMHLYGQISDQTLAQRYASACAKIVRDLTPGAEACLTMGDDQILKFVVPHYL